MGKNWTVFVGAPWYLDDRQLCSCSSSWLFWQQSRKIAKFYEKGQGLVLRRMGKYFNHCAHVLNKSFKGFTGGKDIRKENFPKSEKSGGASLNKVASRQLYGTAALPSECVQTIFKTPHPINTFSFSRFFSFCTFSLCPSSFCLFKC